MNIIYIKYLIGDRVMLTLEGTQALQDTKASDLTEGHIIGINLIDMDDPTSGCEYDLKIGDWVLRGVTEEQIIKPLRRIK